MTATATSARYFQIAPEQLEPPPLLKFSFIAFCLFNAAYYSRFFEFFLTFLHAPLILSLIAISGAAMEGRVVMVFENKIGKCLAILTGFYGLNIIFSTWRGGSFGVFKGDWMGSVLMFVISASLLFTFSQCRTGLQSIGWGTGVAGILVNTMGKMQDGRLMMRYGTLKNSNEIAFDLLLGLPFLWLILRNPKSGNIKKLLVLCLMANSVAAMLRTGSRGGLIGFGLLGLLFFMQSSMVGKAVMLLSGFLLILGAVILLPNTVKMRYASTFSGADAEAVTEAAQTGGDASAVLSASARRELLINSLRLTATHPLFGVGIGQFGSYRANEDIKAGKHPNWYGTHNTYTQISSEAGIPALAAFVTMIWFSLSGVRALHKRAKRFPWTDQQLQNVIETTFALSSALIFYSVCICFDFIAYNATLPVLAGFAIGLIGDGNRELDRMERQPAAEQPHFLNLYPGRPATPAPYAG